MPRIAPYGSWQSPITADLIASGTIGLGQIALDGEDIYWVEMRPAEGGRFVVVRRGPSGHVVDVTPPPFNVRTRVHEYGGGAFTVAAGTVYFSNFGDGRLYRRRPDRDPEPITPAGPYRYADIAVDRCRNRLICVREDHSRAGEPANTLVSMPLPGPAAPVTVASGNDFYSTPRLSPDGSRLAWLTWNHPNMPWDGTELWAGELRADGTLVRPAPIAGGADESVFQPEWSPDGVLHFVSDRTGWWNVFRWCDGSVEPLCPMAAEFGAPQWTLGMSMYGFTSPSRIICAYATGGVRCLATLDTRSGSLTRVDTPLIDFDSVRAAPDGAVFTAGSPTAAAHIVHWRAATNRFDVLRRSTEVVLDSGFVSAAQPIEFPTEQGLTAHAFFYPPRNADYVGPRDARPPLLVFSHGGPTGATSSVFRLPLQYWTSRGIAVLDVNYGGSTGYGRAYRQRLDGQWGIVDVDDCVNGARYVVHRGWVDGNRLAIRGSSAGGYTTLCALTFRNLFKAGASSYGIGDLEALARDTHKFESHYEERLVGPYPARRDVYHARSPIHFTDRLSCPVIFFQGLDDKVVLPSQAEAMVAALRAKGLPVAYVPFAGEQHGFRRAETIKRALEAELYFYARVFGFTLADAVEPVPIENL